MATEDGKRDDMGRRSFLRCGMTGTLAALAALGMRPARAQDFPKMTQDQAGYQDKADSHTCAECNSFQAPDGCKIVQGPVSESGTCNYFAN